MVHSIHFTAGFPAALPIGKKIEFGPRLNIVMGYNGSGKSTLLRAIAASANAALPIEAPAPAVERDQQPIIYRDTSTNTPLFDDHFLDRLKALHSDGERRMGLINELRHHLRDHFPSHTAQSDHRPALLFDEPELHLSPPAQFYLWKAVLPLLSKQFQLIVATHSLFPLLLKNEYRHSREDRLHLLSRGYEEETIAALSRAVDYYNQQESSRKK